LSQERARASRIDLRGEFRELRPLVKKTERAGLALAEASRCCGIDQPALSRLENGHNKNPTLDTLWRYAAAVGRCLVLTTKTIGDTRAAQENAKRANVARDTTVNRCVSIA